MRHSVGAVELTPNPSFCAHSTVTSGYCAQTRIGGRWPRKGSCSCARMTDAMSPIFTLVPGLYRSVIAESDHKKLTGKQAGKLTNIEVPSCKRWT
jgi:hypothetical protein